MFGFIRKCIELLSTCKIESFRKSLVSNSKGPTEFLNNQPCKTRPTLVNINSDETLFFSIYCKR